MVGRERENPRGKGTAGITRGRQMGETSLGVLNKKVAKIGGDEETTSGGGGKEGRMQPQPVRAFCLRALLRIQLCLHLLPLKLALFRTPPQATQPEQALQRRTSHGDANSRYYY